MDPHDMLQEVRSTVNQHTPSGTPGGKCSCCTCVLGLSDQAQHPWPVYWVEQRVEQTFLICIMTECIMSM